MLRAPLLLAFILIAFASQPIWAAEPTLPPEIEAILALPEEKIDIGIAALTFAKDIYPDIDISTYSKKIDELASQVRVIIKNNPDPDFAIRAMNTVIYHHNGYHYDRSPEFITKQENFYITGILDSKTGTCFNMPMLYMAVAQRLGLPVYPVAAPEHVFLRFTDPRLIMKNIEATEGGGYSPDEKYIQDLSIPKEGIASGAYLRTLSYREYLGMLLNNNAVTLSEHQNQRDALKYLERAEELNPLDGTPAENLRNYYKNREQEALSSAALPENISVLLEIKRKIEHYTKKIKETGIVEHPEQ